jgi:hypothetical protein
MIESRTPLRQFAIVFICAGLSIPAAAQDCAERSANHTMESARYRLAYRMVPEKIVVGSHFVIELVVCPKADQPIPDNIRIDAHMPDHRHGMNYKPSIKAGDAGRYRAEGLLFHMPGRWELIFDVGAGGKTDRLTRDHTL